MTTPSNPQSAMVSALEARAVLALLDLSEHPDTRWWRVSEGEYLVRHIGVQVRLIEARGCPAEYEITAAPDHDIWAALLAARIVLARSVRVRDDVLSRDRYARYAAWWMAQQTDEGPAHITRAMYELISYMLRFPARADQAGACPSVLADRVLEAGFRILATA